MEQSFLPDAAPVTAQYSAWIARWQEQDHRYLPQIEAPEPWFWELVPPQGHISHTVALTGALDSPLTVTVRLNAQGPVSDATPAPRIWWDGELLGTWHWAGPAEQSWPATAIGAAGEAFILCLSICPSTRGNW